jgi:hypothetical protein
MKKTDKIAVILSAIAIVGVVFYLWMSGVLGGVDSDVLWIIGVVLLGSIVFVLLFQSVDNLKIRKRIKEFSVLAKKFSLTHTHIAPPVLFTPYGVLNELKGTIKGHSVRIVDLKISPSKVDVAANVLLIDEPIIGAVYNHTARSTKSIYKATKIEIDGKDKTEDAYAQRQALTGVFLEIELVEKFLREI